jgi:hypothetical protein
MPDEQEPKECDKEECFLCEAGLPHETTVMEFAGPSGMPVGHIRNIREEYPVGTRVRVHNGTQTVYLGLGTIVDYVEEMADSPKIAMDDGTEQYGFGCWWETIEQFEKKFAEARSEIIAEEQTVGLARLVPVDNDCKVVDVELTETLDYVIVVAKSDGTRIRMDNGEEQGDLVLLDPPKNE